MFRIKNINSCDIYVALYVLYSMQGVLYPSGLINQLLQFVLILWGLNISFKFFIAPKKQSKMLKATSFLLIMYSLYGGSLLLFGNPFIDHIPVLPARYIYLQVSLRSLLSIFVFYHYAKIGYLTSSRIRIYAVILLFTLIPQYYHQQVESMFESGKEEVTNNIGYTFLSIIPLLFFFNRKPILQYILLAVALLYIIMAMKRGAIAISFVAALALIGSNVFYGNKKHRFWAILLTIVLIIGAVSVVSYMMTESAYFSYRIEQTLSGDSSGRDNIYGKIWQYIFNEQNLFYFLFGRGADATWAIAGNYAHQDWLETLCDNGVVGAFILFVFFFRLFKDAFLSRKLFVKNFYVAYMVLFFTTFSKSMFSMSIQNLALSISLLLGYLNYWLYSSNEERVHEKLS